MSLICVAFLTWVPDVILILAEGSRVDLATIRPTLCADDMHGDACLPRANVPNPLLHVSRTVGMCWRMLHL